MPFSIFDASVPVYRRRLEALSAILNKAAAYAKDRKIDEPVLVQARLYPDMLPLGRQVQMACGHAIRGCARLSGIEPVAIDGNSASFDDLKVWIAKTLEVVNRTEAAKMVGSEDREITFPVGDKKQTLSGSDYLLNFSLPNFYFHLTTAYAILRHNGLAIGKDDYMGDD